MASTLRLARSTNHLTKCLVQADRVSSRPLRSLNGRSYATVSDECCRMPLIGSISISTVKGKYLNFNMPGLEKTESDESLSVFMKMPGVKEEHVKTCIVDMTTHLLSIKGEISDESYFGGKLATEIHRGFMMLPVNVDNNTSKIKTEMLQDGMLKLTIPKLKVDKELLNKTSIFSNIIAKLRYNIIASIPSFILTFARPFVIEQWCFQMFDSFTMYKKETDQSLHIRVTPGIQKLDAISRAMCVSLNMPEINKIEDVKSFFRDEALFIEGKTKTKTRKVHYVTGIRFPEFYDMRRRMIKEKMQDGMYKLVPRKIHSTFQFLLTVGIRDCCGGQHLSQLYEYGHHGNKLNISIKLCPDETFNFTGDIPTVEIPFYSIFSGKLRSGNLSSLVISCLVTACLHQWLAQLSNMSLHHW